MDTPCHAGTEEIIVLEGDLVIGDQVYKPGDRLHSQPGIIHQPQTINGCVIYVRTSLDDEILASPAD
jgi:anti-sigma factor ChrR (cupin superfamily)